MVNVVDENGAIITELKANPGWVSFWSVPSEAPLWGLKPDYLGNNVLKLVRIGECLRNRLFIIEVWIVDDNDIVV